MSVAQYSSLPTRLYFLDDSYNSCRYCTKISLMILTQFVESYLIFLFNTHIVRINMISSVFVVKSIHNEIYSIAVVD